MIPDTSVTRPPGRPSLGVVTVTFNAEAYLQAFLACCLTQQPDDFELLVIDNASSDGTLDIVRQIGDARIHVLANSDNIGYAAACNQGVRHFAQLGIDEILFINNDTEFDSGLFATLVSQRRAYQANAVTPRITYFDDAERDWYAGGRFVFWKGFQGAHLHGGNRRSNAPQTPHWTEVAPGCCVLFTLDTFEQIGLFVPTYFVYFEDTDFFLRMRRAGLRLLYLPETVVAHKISLATGGPQSDFSIRYYQRNQIYALRKHFSPAVILTQLPLLFAKATLRRLLGRDDTRQYLLRLRGMREGLSLPLRPADGGIGSLSR